MRDDARYKSRRGGGEDNVIDIEKKKNMIRPKVIGKEGEVRPTAGESKRGDKNNKSLIPGSRSFLENIESFVKS